MTNEEAIEHGKEDLEVFGGTHAEFIKLSLKAIEKQIPKKPKYVICTDTYCICGSIIRNSSKFCDEYCDHCGQAIDWSDKNE